MKPLSIGSALLTSLLISGCSTAGPYVTNISSDGKGGLVIEKTMIEYNGLVGVVSQKNPSSTTIQLIPKDESK